MIKVTDEGMRVTGNGKELSVEMVMAFHSLCELFTVHERFALIATMHDQVKEEMKQLVLDLMEEGNDDISGEGCSC